MREQQAQGLTDRPVDPRPAAQAGTGSVGSSPADGASSALRPGVVGPVLLALVGAYAVVQSVQLGLWANVGPGPGFFPLVLGGLLVLLSVVWLVQDVAAAPAARSASYGPSLDRRHTAEVLSSLVAVAALLIPLGFQVAMSLFLLFHLRRRTSQRWPASISFAVVAAVAVFHLFNDALGVRLPLSQITVLFRAGI